ncbi:MAG: HNH endonuclease family protein [Pigmentiphaga sp.]|nr:HNH endonuclease family protein [Pigmentiphaga sp.]
MVYRLGNMILMQSGANRQAGIQEYPEERALFAQSGFEITRKLANDNAEWTPQRIAMWQNWMADQATSIWRIAQLS